MRLAYLIGWLAALLAMLWLLIPAIIDIVTSDQFAEVIAPRPAISPAFVLERTDGSPVDETVLVGRPSLVVFGFTHCPDVCPTTLAEMAAWMATADPTGTSLQAIFVTLDPQRDTPGALREYVEAFGVPITALTGSLGAVHAAARSFGVHHRRIERAAGDYTLDHTAAVFLFDQSGRFRDLIDFGEPKAGAVAKLRKLVPAAATGERTPGTRGQRAG